ncbi:MAG: hypothetical protein O3A25_07985, partial [Acidobacteria bacterium]|nr:hypothetical protein [Acidobacteriota bacterium]
HRSNTAGIFPLLAWFSRPSARLVATRDFHHGLLAGGDPSAFHAMPRALCENGRSRPSRNGLAA